MTRFDFTKFHRITIDDLGLFPGVERSVMELAGIGIALHGSWVTNYYPPSRAYKELKTVAAGLHFNVLEGASELHSKLLTDKSLRFNRAWREFLYPSRQMRIETEAELEFQLEKVHGWFGRIDHVDSHLHLHSIPWINRLIAGKQHAYGFSHVRYAYQKLSDRPSLKLKLAALWLLHFWNKSSAPPCFGVDQAFRMSPERCVKILQKGAREFIWHTLSGDDEIERSKYRFITAEQIQLRRQEHARLKKFLTILAAIDDAYSEFQLHTTA